MLERPDWKINRPTTEIDLSKNVHYDATLVANIKDALASHTSFHDYPNQYDLYLAISTYYNIPITNLTIGYGGTEVIERIFKTIPFDDVYIVEPTFEMLQVYCTLYNKRFHVISMEDVPNCSGGTLYIANPSGNTGQVLDVTPYLHNFELCIVDEAYADFCSTYSILHSYPDNVIVVKTLSKSLGIGGFRVGFCVANNSITELLQATRSNFICSSFASKIIPQIINETPGVISRMLLTKQYLEGTYSCKPSNANYVLFSKPNRFTNKFNARVVQGYYRMALIDIETLLI